MDKDEIIPYRLYALSTGKRGVEIAAQERFARVTPYYILIYTKSRKPVGAIDIADGEEKRLSDEDERWLIDCATAILAEEIEKNKPKLFDTLSERIEELERELARRKEEMGVS